MTLWNHWKRLCIASITRRKLDTFYLRNPSQTKTLETSSENQCVQISRYSHPWDPLICHWDFLESPEAHWKDPLNPFFLNVRCPKPWKRNHVPNYKTHILAIYTFDFLFCFVKLISLCGTIQNLPKFYEVSKFVTVSSIFTIISGTAFSLLSILQLNANDLYTYKSEKICYWKLPHLEIHLKPWTTQNSSDF